MSEPTKIELWSCKEHNTAGNTEMGCPVCYKEKMWKEDGVKVKCEMCGKVDCICDEEYERKVSEDLDDKYANVSSDNEDYYDHSQGEE